MNIVFIRNSFNVGGAEIYNIYLYTELSQYEDINCLFLSNNHKFINELQSLRAKTKYLNLSLAEVGTKKELLNFILYIPRYYWEYLRVFLQISKSFFINIICFESMTEKLFLSPFFCLIGTKVIWIEHGPLFDSQRSLFIKFLYRIISFFPHKIIAVSNHTNRDLINGGVKKEKIETIYIGISSNKYSDKFNHNKFKRSLNINKNDIVISYAGALNHDKGFKDFMLLVNCLTKKTKRIKFLVLGEGELAKWAQEYGRGNGIDSTLIFTGWVKQIKNYLNITDIFIFPTRCREGLPLVLLEASLAGCLVISSDTGGGSREVVVEGKTGFFYDFTQTEKICAFTYSTIKRIRNKEINQIRQNAKLNILDNFNFDINGRKFYELLNAI